MKARQTLSSSEPFEQDGRTFCPLPAWFRILIIILFKWLNSYIWCTDGILRDTTTLRWSGSGSNGKESILHIPWSFRTWASSSDIHDTCWSEMLPSLQWYSQCILQPHPTGMHKDMSVSIVYIALIKNNRIKEYTYAQLKIQVVKNSQICVTYITANKPSWSIY